MLNGRMDQTTRPTLPPPPPKRPAIHETSPFPSPLLGPIRAEQRIRARISIGFGTAFPPPLSVARDDSDASVFGRSSNHGTITRRWPTFLLQWGQETISLLSRPFVTSPFRTTTKLCHGDRVAYYGFRLSKSGSEVTLTEIFWVRKLYVLI